MLICYHINMKNFIIPSIDLLDGNVVRLKQGDYNKATVYEVKLDDLVEKCECDDECECGEDCKCEDCKCEDKPVAKKTTAKKTTTKKTEK